MSSVKKNLGYQTVYQILATCLPLITSPYLSRRLGATQLGIYSFTNSIVLYFTLFAMLGTVNYGTRSIAAVKDNNDKCGEVFWSIYLLQALMSIIAMAGYCLYFAFLCEDNKLIAFIQLFQIVNCFLDINWFFFGLEQFKVTVTRNLFVKLGCFVLLFVFVKNENDLWKYAVLMVASNIISQFILWFKLPKWCWKSFKFDINGIRAHIRPNIVLFIPLLAMSVYHVMDKTMLGAMSSKEQVGFYYNADKLVNIPLTIIYGVGTVMLPRIANLLANDNRKEADKLYRDSIEGVALASTAMAFGIAAVANEFVPFFFGKGFIQSIKITIVLAPVLVAKGISNTVRTEYLIPNKLENQFLASVIAGAITNLIANIIFIPQLGGFGAAIGTLLAEIVACVWQVLSTWKYIDMKKTLMDSAIFMLLGVIMFCSVRWISGNLILGIIPKLLIEVSTGILVYFVLAGGFLLLTKNPLLKTLINTHQNVRK